jgi:signal transduction histidine kinase/ActR/RegA family two-component response regulator/HAMP domain-containing protein
VAAVAPGLSAERLRRVALSRLPDTTLAPDGETMEALQSFGLPSDTHEVRSMRRALAYVRIKLEDQHASARHAEVEARLPDLIGMLVVSLLMFWLLHRHVARPLASLDAAAKRLRAGDLAVDIPHQGFQEIRQLGAGLDALRQELAATWHALPDLLFEMDPHGRYLRVLASRPELLMDAPQRLQGRSIHEVMPDEAARTIQEALDEAGRTGGVWGREVPLQVAAGLLWFEISVARKTNPETGQISHIVISRDITERKHDAMELARLNEALEQRVQDRTAELLNAKNEADRANQSKSDFLSGMSHELRTPLNAILGFGQLLSLSALRPDQQRQVQHIVNAGRHLLELINEILDLSRVEAGQMPVTLEAVDLQPLLDECLALVQPLADAHGVHILGVRAQAGVTSTASWRAQADRTRLRQVLINLLSNGIKYNRPQGSLRVDVSLQAQSWTVAVHDTGKGLSAEQIQRLFTPFERLDADQGHAEGTGIGLALSKRLMALMNGSIDVSSQPGQGSCFSLHLPRSQHMPHAHAAAAPPALPFATTARLPPCTVLCIEDDEVNMQLITQLLATQPDIHLLSALDARLGLQLALVGQPDLILLDMNLPDMNGDAVIGQLKASPETAGIPVVAVTANAMPADLARVHVAGFSAYVTKPIDAPSLLETLRQLRLRAYDARLRQPPASAA